jgi:hypothetical protein
VSAHDAESPMIGRGPGATLFWLLLLIVAAEAAAFLV